MNKEESEDAESAYGSEISSNSTFLTKKNTFTIEDSKMKSRRGLQIIKFILRESMLVEASIFLGFFVILIFCRHIAYQNEETQKMISSLQSQFNSFQKQGTGEDYLKKKQEETEKLIEDFLKEKILETEEMIKDKHEKIKEVSDEYLEGVRIQSEEVLKEIRMRSEEVLNEVKTKSVVQLEPSVNNKSTNAEEKSDVPPIIPTVSTHPTLKRYNAASLINGATVDSSLSSSSSLSNTSFFDFDQSSLVLVDRPEPPANKAWCTYEKNPVLTVNLAKYIKPTAVSYQHSKWNGTVPDDAPKEYSVEACLDNYCMNRQPLFSNCEYNSNGHQEQICNITNHSIDSPVKKLQIKFHENHGNTGRTCVSLVRVYSAEVAEQKFRSLGDTTTCLDWKHTYQNNPFYYKYKRFKTCNDLYSKGCCQECPECCEECQIKDFDADVIFPIALIVILAIFGVLLYLLLVKLIEL